MNNLVSDAADPGADDHARSCSTVIGPAWKTVVNDESSANPAGPPSYCPEHPGGRGSGWIHSCWSVGTDRDTGKPLTIAQKALARVMMRPDNRACGYKFVLDHEVTLQAFRTKEGATCFFCWDSNQSR
jgi:hypothetical protein